MRIFCESAFCDPYRAIGLARNPFIIEESPGVATDVWIERGLGVAPPPSGAMLVQILGPRGAGKTSQILHWRASHPGPYRHVPESFGRWRPPPVAAISYWDEADRIPSPILALALRRAARIRATIVAATHRDLGATARGAGLAIETHIMPQLDETTLAAWIGMRIAAARCVEGSIEPPRPDGAMIARLVAGCDGSFRTAADRLHVWIAGRAAGA